MKIAKNTNSRQRKLYGLVSEHIGCLAFLIKTVDTVKAYKLKTVVALEKLTRCDQKMNAKCVYNILFVINYGPNYFTIFPPNNNILPINILICNRQGQHLK